MYLAYRPAMMLPTVTLNPTQEASQPENTGSTRAKIRRSIDNRKVTGIKKHSVVDYNSLWWFGVSMIAAGGAGWYFCKYIDRVTLDGLIMGCKRDNSPQVEDP